MTRASFVGAIQWADIEFRIKAYVTTTDSDLALHQLHRLCNTKISQHKYCQQCTRYLTDEDLVKAVQVDGKWVLFSPSDIAKVYPEVDTRLVVHETITPAEVAPNWQDKVYYIIPAEDIDAHVYALLSRSLRDEHRYAVVTYTTYKRTRLGVLCPSQEGLVLHSLHYAESTQTLASLDVSIEPTKLSAQEITLGRQLVRSMTRLFVYGAYTDVEQSRLRTAVLAKSAQKEIAEIVSVERPTSSVMNLAERLKLSITEVRKKVKKVKPSPTRKRGVK